MRTSWPLGRHVAPFYSGIYTTRLHLSPEELGTARAQLIDLELIAYQAPLYQVLSLPGTQGAPQTAPMPPTPAPRRENSAGPVRLAHLFEQMARRRD